MLASLIGVVMCLDYQVDFLREKHVEEGISHGAGGVAGAYAELVSGHYYPFDS